jgi:hypothetical protein
MYGPCECCGGRLECFEGERYCPDCCLVEVLRPAGRADDEARLPRLAEPAGPGEEGPSGAGAPF